MFSISDLTDIAKYFWKTIIIIRKDEATFLQCYLCTFLYKDKLLKLHILFLIGQNKYYWRTRIRHMLWLMKDKHRSINMPFCCHTNQHRVHYLVQSSLSRYKSTNNSWCSFEQVSNFRERVCSYFIYIA